MHIIHQGLEHPGQLSIAFLPMTDLYSGDKTCILSMLDIVCDLTNKHQVPSIITFDQPLCWKAAEIIMDAPKSNHFESIVDAWTFPHVHEPSWYNRYTDGGHYERLCMVEI